MPATGAAGSGRACQDGSGPLTRSITIRTRALPRGNRLPYRYRLLAAALATAGLLGVAAVLHATPTAKPHPGPAASVAAVRPSASPTPSPSPTTAAHWVEVSLGDSVPAGSACTCRPFPAVYADKISARTGASVTVHNLAQPGQTSSGLLDALRHTPAYAEAVSRADIVTVTIGANDFGFGAFQRGGCTNLRCYAAGLRALQHNLDATVSLIESLRGGRQTAIRMTGYWDIWRDGQVAQRQGATYARVGDRLTKRVNAVIAAVAAAHQVTYVDLFTPFRGPDGDRDDTALLASDGDHPSKAGHTVIAQALMASGLSPISSE